MANMQEFCSYISDSLISASYVSSQKIRIVLPYDDPSDLKECGSTLLLCSPEDAGYIAGNTAGGDVPNIVICGASEGESFEDLADRQINLAVSRWSLPKVANKLSKAFRDYTEYKKALDNTIANEGGLHELLAEAVKLSGGRYHFYVFSNNFVLIDSGVPDTFSEGLPLAGSPSDEQTSLIRELLSGRNSVNSVVTPVLDGGNTIAYLLITGKDMSDATEMMRNMLARRTANLLTNTYAIYSREQKDLQKLLTDILVLMPKDVDTLNKRLHSLPHPLKSHVRIMIISGLKDKSPIWMLCSKVQDLLPDCNVTVYDNKIVALFSGDSFLFRIDSEEKKLEKFLKDNNAYAMLSSPAKFIKGLRTLYMEARELLPKIPLLMDVSKTPLVYFEDVFGFYRVHLCSVAMRQHLGHDKFIYLAHPVAIQLIRYDIEHKTDYFEFIVEYSKCSGNIQETASRLHMHRNSAYNKLNKITELMNVDFSNGLLMRNLIFSMNIIKYNGVKPQDLIVFSETPGV